MNTNEPAVLYVADLAKMLGRTETALRAAVNRGAKWLPPSFMLGRRIAWNRSTVAAFLAAQEKAGR